VIEERRLEKSARLEIPSSTSPFQPNFDKPPLGPYDTMHANVLFPHLFVIKEQYLAIPKTQDEHIGCSEIQLLLCQVGLIADTVKICHSEESIGFAVSFERVEEALLTFLKILLFPVCGVG
jgi:hypothetical protein